MTAESSAHSRIAAPLVAYALETRELVPLIENAPVREAFRAETLEYELRLLKIVSAGWAITFLLEGHEEKSRVSEAFWTEIGHIATSIDTQSKALGTEIRYFDEVRSRFDDYLGWIRKAGDKDPAFAVGFRLAERCGVPDDAYPVVCARKVFNGSIGSIRSFLWEVLPRSPIPVE